MHWKAFDKAWFRRHQNILLWFLNGPLRNLSRRIFRIHGDLGKDEEIDEIAPNRFRVCVERREDELRYRVDFRTHAKFSKRAYYAFRPLWWAMHFWDWAFADRFAPALSFGFDSLTKYPDADPEGTTVDGSIETWFSLGTTWSAVRDATDGNSAYPSSASESFTFCRAFTTLDNYKGIGRGFFLFDTSALPDSDPIDSAVLSIWGTSKEDGYSSTPTIDIYTSSPASNTNLVVGDFDQVGSTSQTGSPMSYASFSTTGYNAFSLNATGIGNISKTGVSKFSSRNANHDVANTPPTWVSGARWYFGGYYADQTGTTNDPKLVVTYVVNSNRTATVGSGTISGAAPTMDLGIKPRVAVRVGTE